MIGIITNKTTADDIVRELRKKQESKKEK